MLLYRCILSLAFSAAGVLMSTARAADVEALANDLAPWADALAGRLEHFSMEGQCRLRVDGQPRTIRLRLARYDADSFDLAVTDPQYAVAVYRRADRTAFVLPKHGRAYVGTGAAPQGRDGLGSAGVLGRLISSDSQLALIPVLLNGTPESLAGFLDALLQIQRTQDGNAWLAGGRFRIEFGGESLKVTDRNFELTLRLTTRPPKAIPDVPREGLRVESLPRAEIERSLVRGVRRVTEILLPSSSLLSPAQQPRQCPQGRLIWIDGQRVALLWGTPEQIGAAHGTLLRDEVHRCVDSVLYAFGTVQTIRTGRWFRHDLEEAYRRLAPHIPQDHKRELDALAEASGLDRRLAHTVNVFPELFHCSGFAVCNSATTDGTLYHGRVLDYMTAIGLQDAAVTFVVDPEGKIPFVNVGYAGFTGSVSGMNAEGISLGEMGGRGEGRWDGVPMGTLMRRALEECRTLEEVMALWRNSPRTCEYFYVFADGKTNRAVGVAARPESIEFIGLGEAHPLLGPGIPDTVALSAGERLKVLRQRIQQKHGRIDAEVAMWLMSRPVAMKSNLHNVLFVPAKGLLYVAHADHRHPAAERPYVKLDFHALLRRARREATAAAQRR
ncbi:MAG: peptidase C45 acyl-coenzyme A:6-aminopenicillanic acid acyl-transferase [Planctomycetota bacterium]|nr:MAG: peptidase C45 acyl-coenzyme A:6-aminopenicillanic acid acyl-transferase [Planctomycetota bacterium]